MSHLGWQKALMAGIVLVSAAGTTLADDNDNRWGFGWGMNRMMGQGPGWMGGDYGLDEMLDRIDGRLAYLKTELKITEAQAPAWDELATVIRDTAETHNKLMRSTMEEFRNGDFAKKSLPDRLTLQLTHLEARVEQTKAVKSAVDKLYVLLSAEQKQTADEIVLPTMGMGMGRGQGGGPGMLFR